MQFVQVHARPRRGYMDQVPSQPTSDMLTVLVVDDDRELRESLSAFLRHRGCSVKAAAGGVEGAQAGIPGPLGGAGTDTPLPRTRGFWRDAPTPAPGPPGPPLFCPGREPPPRRPRPPHP